VEWARWDDGIQRSRTGDREEIPEAISTAISGGEKLFGPPPPPARTRIRIASLPRRTTYRPCRRGAAHAFQAFSSLDQRVNVVRLKGGDSVRVVPWWKEAEELLAAESP